VHKSGILLASLVIGALGIGLFCGCEGDPDTEDVDKQFDDSSYAGGDRPDSREALMSITPPSAMMTVTGQIQSFRVDGASGGVSWSLQNQGIGTIVTEGDRTATYRRDADGDNVLIVRDNSNGELAFATIYQDDMPAMVISPDAVTLTNGAMSVVFSVANAEGAVNWEVQNGNGTIVPQSNEAAIYTRTSPGPGSHNIVIAEDATGRTTSATVLQP
jgi:hypothetical protein